jgi:streptogramin lyase
MRGNQVTQTIRPAPAAGRLRLLALPLAVAAFLALSAAPALAAKTHRLIATFTAGYSVSAVVDEASGNIFVADAKGNVVNIVGPEGGVPSGVAPPYKIEGVSGVQQGGMAVDNAATSPSKGALYIVAGSSTVKKFVLNPITEKYALAKELSASPAFERATSIAVDSKGDLFVGDEMGKAVVEFDPSGTQIARFDLVATLGAPRSVAVDSKGDLFVSAGATYRFDANGSGEIEAGTEPVQIVKKVTGSPGGKLAVDLGTDELYVSEDPGGETKDVYQYSASCAPEGEDEEEHCHPEGEFGSGAIFEARSVAVNSKTGLIYVADSAATEPHVAVFGPTLIVPGSTTGAATNLTGTAATLNGTVDPSGSEVDECKFEYGIETDHGNPEAHPPVPPSFSYTNTVPCAESPAQIGAGNAPVPVHADIAGLGLGTRYHFRLLATSATTIPNEKGPSVGADEAFTTLGPQVHAESASGVSDTAVKLEGLVNPEGEATTSVFEYVSQADFEASEYAKATSVPPGGEVIGFGSADVKVAQQISGLSPATTYHFRIAATNPAGTVHGPDRVFMTYTAPQAFPDCPNGVLREALGSASLSDCRAYEQVTPVDKNGTAPRGENARVQAASGGDGLVYFAHGGIPGSEGAQKDPLYLASRGSDWSTQGLLPPASGGASASVMGWSEDLAHAYDSQALLPTAPASFLERDSATRSLRAIVSEGGKNTGDFNYIGTSSDSAVVAFESDTVLAPGGRPKFPNLYVWDAADGNLSLAGVFNNEQVPTKGTLAGSNELSGSRRHYTQAQHTLSSDGSGVFFSDVGSGQLYLRRNPTQPQSTLDGEGECTEAALACTVQVSASQRAVPDPKGKKPAAFVTATPDGSKAFFTSPGKLTDDATTGPKDEGNDLYRYDAGTGELIDLTHDAADPNGAEVRGVLGASADGSHVYFAANGVLTSTPNAQGQSAAPGDCSSTTTGDAGSGSCNLYLWHDGVTDFIAQLQLQQSGYGGSDSANWLSAALTLAPGIENTARVSGDGQTLLFRSRRALTAYDSEGLPELYRYVAATGDLRCVSCNPTGAAPVGAASLRSIETFGEAPPEPASVLTRNLSADGTRIFFETADKLVANDTNGEGECPVVTSTAARSCQDVYEWEANGSGSCQSEAQNGGCLYLLSSGTSPEPSYFGDASASGNDAFIYTTQPLVDQDKDQIVDVYDARVGGGIASQNPPPEPEPCLAETSCRGEVPAPAPTQFPGSTSFSGPGNQKPSHHKKKKRQHKKKQHKKRHTAGKQR